MAASDEAVVCHAFSCEDQEEDFQSADEDDFDLPQDIGIQGTATGSAAAPGLGGGGGGGVLPPGFDPGAAQEGSGTERWNLRQDGNKEELEPIWLELSKDREHIKISKMFSYVLRHAAHKLDVTIRKDGFVRLRDIMKLRNFKPYGLEQLMAVVYFDEKERYTMVREYDGELLIRANQGHTMKVVEDDLLLELITDPSTVTDCVHGTYLVHWPFIKRQGLSKVARNHIHLANGLPEDGKIRGMRQTSELFVYIDVPRAMEDGIAFYRSKNEVILTQGLEGWLPPKYFVKAVRIDYNTCDVEEMEFDRCADTPSWAAELAPTGPGEAGTYLIKNLEALISNCKKRLAEINDLKALAEAGKALDAEEEEKLSKHAQVYTELQSLEQRFRQHKGYRKESVQDKEQRMREEAEARTVVERKDRAVTPPWERGKPSALEQASNTRATEKEKAEWAALGRRRDTAPTPTAKKEDMAWSRLRGNTAAPSSSSKGGFEKKGSFSGERAGGREGGFERRGSFSGERGGGREDDLAWGRLRGNTAAPSSSSKGGFERKGSFGNERPGGRETDNWRFRNDDDRPAHGRADRTESQRIGREESTRLSTSSTGGPPRFFNSKKDTGVSWRDRVGTKDEGRRDSAQGGNAPPAAGGHACSAAGCGQAPAAPPQPGPGWSAGHPPMPSYDAWGQGPGAGQMPGGGQMPGAGQQQPGLGWPAGYPPAGAPGTGQMPGAGPQPGLGWPGAYPLQGSPGSGHMPVAGPQQGLGWPAGYPQAGSPGSGLMPGAGPQPGHGWPGGYPEAGMPGQGMMPVAPQRPVLAWDPVQPASQGAYPYMPMPMGSAGPATGQAMHPGQGDMIQHAPSR